LSANNGSPWRTTVRLGEPDSTLGSSPKEPVGACFAGTCAKEIETQGAALQQ
jgi:hypothetical protein